MMEALVITKNKVKLLDELRVDHDLCAVMEENQIFSSANVDDVMSETKKQNRNNEFLVLVRQRGPRALQCFVFGLRKTAQSDLADLIESGCRPQRQDVIDSRLRGAVSNPSEQQTTSGQPVCQPTVTLAWPGESDGPGSEGEEMQCEPTQPILKVYDCFEETIPVKPATPKDSLVQRVRSEKEDYYAWNGKKGLAVIVNIYRVEGEPDRHGANCDRENLKQLFETLQFKVHIYQDLSSEKIKTTLKNYAQRLELKEVDVFVLCVMSHGAEGQVMGSDGGFVSIQEDIINPFHTDNCPFLAKKPKVVLLQACQGGQTTRGPCIDGLKPRCTSRDANTESPAWADTQQLQINADRDFLIGCSTCTGFVSLREVCGSWFIRAFVMEMHNHCHEEHMADIMTKVIKSVGQCRSFALYEDMDLLIQRPYQISSLQKKLHLFIPPMK